ncbi:transglutaminase domain-containing protein [Actinomadura graeca]|uniref:Transglutaminase domain-containing protein n=1 Tax=Actinomadura graeca TaxID=2750812 RepID=A0ABX8R2R7_9ACTN|nr:DUF3488 and transglutaminase-like domain-containing protein [Actinomadura graeca]QXJ25390.1 transglutaminase domain-containing protein [Actinomadura graeca]
MTLMAGLATLAGSAGLYPLFESNGWFWAGLGSVLAVAGGGLLARRFRLPAVVSPLAGLAALLVYLTAVYARDSAWLWVVPSPASLRYLSDLAAEGWDAANRYAAPVPLVPGIALLASAGVGAVATLVDLLAVRLRRAAPAGLPLLAMYSVPAAVRDDGVGWIAFGVGAAGFLALLMADARERVGGWGRTVTARRRAGDVPMAGAQAPEEPRPRADGAALAASGRRIGAGAVAVAVALPMAVPGIHPRGMFGLGEGSGGGTQTVTTPDPLVSLKRELTRVDDSVVLTYRSDDPAGPDYLRLYALDRFDGDRWTYTALKSSSKDRLSDRDIPAPPGLEVAPAHEVTTRVRVRPEVRNMTFLPVPYAPSRVSIKGDWRVHPASLMVYSLRDSAGGRSFTVRSLRAQPTAANLASAGGFPYPAEIASRYTAVPRNVPPEVRALAQKVTAGASTMHGQAVRLQRWFTQTGGFVYDLAAPAPQHGSDLVDFLLHSKRGYCEQYAAAMALLARILGIPSRVAMGYTPGTETRPGEWTVRSRDAHAWPELYFAGSGWVRFEPTPSGSSGQGTATTPVYSQPAVPGGSQQSDGSSDIPSSDSPEDDPTATAGAGPRHRQDDEGPESAPVGAEEDGRGFSAAPWLAGALLVGLLMAVPMLLRLLTRRRRWAVLVPPPSAGPAGPRAPAATDPAGAAHAAWREMRADALDHGLDWPPSDTPRAAARRLGELLELDAAGSEALGRIARAEELARYSRSLPPAPPERLRADVRTVREAFAASVGRRARWRARLLPPSTLAEARGTLRSAGGRAAELTEWLNGLPARLRRR